MRRWARGRCAHRRRCCRADVMLYPAPAVTLPPPPATGQLARRAAKVRQLVLGPFLTQLSEALAIPTPYAIPTRPPPSPHALRHPHTPYDIPTHALYGMVYLVPMRSDADWCLQIRWCHRMPDGMPDPHLQEAAAAAAAATAAAAAAAAAARGGPPPPPKTGWNPQAGGSSHQGGGSIMNSNNMLNHGG